MTDPQRTPTRRADAERNRRKILAVARAALAEPGDPVSMAEIARRAGVGMATLYRNFPGRRELLEALYADEVDTVCAAAASTPGATPGERFTAWLREFVAFSRGKRHIAAELLTHVAGDDPVFNVNRDRVLGAGRRLLEEAQHAGEVRADLSLEQVLDLILAVAAIDRPRDYVDPMLATALDGLRTDR